MKQQERDRALRKLDEQHEKNRAAIMLAYELLKDEDETPEAKPLRGRPTDDGMRNEDRIRKIANDMTGDISQPRIMERLHVVYPGRFNKGHRTVITTVLTKMKKEGLLKLEVEGKAGKPSIFKHI